MLEPDTSREHKYLLRTREMGADSVTGEMVPPTTMRLDDMWRYFPNCPRIGGMIQGAGAKFCRGIEAYTLEKFLEFY